MMDRFREYLVVGGMPEAVAAYFNSKDSQPRRMAQVRALQEQLLDAYSGDFAKYSGRIASAHIVAVFRSIPAQLARESKNFKPAITIPGSRFSQLRNAVEWLVGAGLILRVPIIDNIEIPLVAQVQENRFKPYFLDVGLLGALAQITPATLMLGDELFTTFKGALCENVVAQALVCSGYNALYCWEGQQAEVEFIVSTDTEMLPIEVKSGRSGKLKSLNVYHAKYNPAYRTRISAMNLQVRPQDSFANLPLWLACRFKEIIA
jgi:predicted AAA+ superfamily ATPase